MRDGKDFRIRGRIGAAIDAPDGGSALFTPWGVFSHALCRDVGCDHRFADWSCHFRHLFGLADDDSEPRSESRVACSGREQSAHVSLHSSGGSSRRHGASPPIPNHARNSGRPFDGTYGGGRLFRPPYTGLFALDKFYSQRHLVSGFAGMAVYDAIARRAA
jgi:hypothetical protein